MWVLFFDSHINLNQPGLPNIPGISPQSFNLPLLATSSEVSAAPKRGLVPNAAATRHGALNQTWNCRTPWPLFLNDLKLEYDGFKNNGIQIFLEIGIS